MKALVFFMLMLAHTGLWAQDWEVKSVSNFVFEMPKPNRIETATNGQAYTYQSDSMFMTVTILPDSTEFRPATNLDFSRYYAMRLNTAALRLHAKLQESVDTSIANYRMHYSSSKIELPNNSVMMYDMLQFFQNDTLFAFSCQYTPSERANVRMRDRFFNNLDFGQEMPRTGVLTGRLWPLITAFGLVIIGIVVYYFTRKGKKA